MCQNALLLCASARRRGNLVLVSFALVLWAGGILLNPCILGAEGEMSPVQDSPEARASTGPAITDYNTPGFKISKVVRIERTLNALGIAAQFGKTNKVGKYVELPKRLESSESGEYFIVTWKYSPKHARRKDTVKDKSESVKPSDAKPEISLPLGKVVLQVDYKLSNEEHLETLVREYPGLRKGTYHLQVENTGTSYRRRGRIEYWRVQLFADGGLAARKESFLWPVFHGREKTAAGEEG
jgi:hypothetical protein